MQIIKSFKTKKYSCFGLNISFKDIKKTLDKSHKFKKQQCGKWKRRDNKRDRRWSCECVTNKAAATPLHSDEMPKRRITLTYNFVTVTLWTPKSAKVKATAPGQQTKQILQRPKQRGRGEIVKGTRRQTKWMSGKLVL